jgi:hypothetical protein
LIILVDSGLGWVFASAKRELRIIASDREFASGSKLGWTGLRTSWVVGVIWVRVAWVGLWPTHATLTHVKPTEPNWFEVTGSQPTQDVNFPKKKKTKVKKKFFFKQILKKVYEN